MSEKIKMKNGTVFNLIPMGIVDDAKKRSFSFTSLLTFAEVEAIFLNPENFTSIMHQSETGETLSTYADCVSYRYIGKDATNGVYTVTLSTDAVETALREVSASITNQQAYVDSAICELTLLISMGGMS